MKRIAKNTICLKPGEYIAPGQEINLTKEEEKTLDTAGALQDKNAAGRAAAQTGPSKPSGRALTAAIAAAIGTIDPKIEEAWTAGGKPSALQLERILGYAVTTEERDVAWAEIQKGAGQKDSELGV